MLRNVHAHVPLLCMYTRRRGCTFTSGTCARIRTYVRVRGAVHVSKRRLKTQLATAQTDKAMISRPNGHDSKSKNVNQANNWHCKGCRRALPRATNQLAQTTAGKSTKRTKMNTTHTHTSTPEVVWEQLIWLIWQFNNRAAKRATKQCDTHVNQANKRQSKQHFDL